MMLQLPLNLSLDQAATFENFMPGGNAELLHQLTKAGAEGESFIFAYGVSGCGKSHLAQAVSLAQSSDGESVAYLPLSNPMLVPEMLTGLGQSHTVVADDFHQVIESTAWQTAFFNLYNEIRELGGNLYLFSEKPIAQLAIQLADLRSRLNAMAVYQIKPIADEAINEFICWRGKKMGLSISPEVATFLENRLSRDAKSLVEALTRLDKASLAQQRKLTIPFVKSVLEL